MDDGRFWFWFGSLVWFVVICFLIALAASSLYTMGYRAGQIDALNGAVKYELHTNDDGETVWREIKEVRDD